MDQKTPVAIKSKTSPSHKSVEVSSFDAKLMLSSMFTFELQLIVDFNKFLLA